MVLDDTYTAGRNASPVEAFDTDVSRACTLLDDLRATELVWDRFEQLDAWYARENADGALIERVDSSATTGGEYPFDAPWINDFHVMTEDLAVESKVLAAEEIATCSANAGSFDAGTLTRQARPVLEPNPDILATQAHNLARAAETLYGLGSGLDRNEDSMPGFVLDLRRNGWSEGSLSSDSFFDFYGDLSDLVGRYSEATDLLAITTAGAARVIGEFQNLVMELGRGARQEAEAALVYWQENKAPYTADMSREAQPTMVTKAAEVTKTVTDVAKNVPVLKAGAGAVGAVASIVEFGSPRYEVTISTSRARTAQAIHDDLDQALADARAGLDEALDALRQRELNAGGSFEAFSNNAEGNSGWEPPRVEF